MPKRLIPPPVQTGSGSAGWRVSPLPLSRSRNDRVRHPVRASRADSAAGRRRASACLRPCGIAAFHFRQPRDKGLAMSRFTILLGGDFVRTPRARRAGRRRARHRRRRRHAACRDARRRAGTVGRRFRFRAGRTCRPSWPPCRARRFPPDKDKTDGELAVADSARARRDLAGAGRRVRRHARRPRLPASGAGASGWPRKGIADDADQRRAGRLSAAAGHARLRLSTTARCSASSASPIWPACRSRARNGRSTASRCRSARR